MDTEKPQGGEPVRIESSVEAREAREKERFTSFHDSVLFGVGNLEGVTTIKIGYGDVRVAGFGVVDGAYDLGGRTIGVCVQELVGGSDLLHLASAAGCRHGDRAWDL